MCVELRLWCDSSPYLHICVGMSTDRYWHWAQSLSFHYNLWVSSAQAIELESASVCTKVGIQARFSCSENQYRIYLDCSWASQDSAQCCQEVLCLSRISLGARRAKQLRWREKTVDRHAYLTYGGDTESVLTFQLH